MTGLGAIGYLVSFALAIVVFLAVIARGGGALWILEVRAGQLAVRRGKPSKRLLEDFRGALRHVDRATLKAHRDGGHLRLSWRGDIDDGTAQRLRNILGLHEPG